MMTTVMMMKRMRMMKLPMTVTGRVFRGMVVGDEGSSWGEMGETKMDQKQEPDVINSQTLSPVARWLFDEINPQSFTRYQDCLPGSKRCFNLNNGRGNVTMF